MKNLSTANELTTRNLKAVPRLWPSSTRMGPDGVTRPRLAANEHLREIVTIAGDRSEGPLSDALADADVIARRAEESRSLAAAPDETTARQPSDFQGLEQVVRTHHTLAAQLNQAVQALDRAEQNCAAAATTSAQHFTQQQAELATAKAEAATLRESLERQLATIYVRAADAEAAAERLTRREAELAAAVEAHQHLQRRFSAAIVLLQEQDADLEATTKRLTMREAELAQVTDTRLSLEAKLAEAESALDQVVLRSADDRSAAIQQAAQRESEFDALLRAEVAKYDTLTGDLLATRQQLAHAQTMLQEAEARHAAAMMTAAAERDEQEAQHEARIAEAGAARDFVNRQLHETAATLDRARQDHLAHASAAAERLAQEEAKVRAEIVARQMLEKTLAGAHAALQAAEQGAAAERLAGTQRAAERDAEFAARLHQEEVTREALEQALTAARNKVAETETALRDAEYHHASQMTTMTAGFADQQVQYESRLAEATAARNLVDERLREVEASLERSRKDAAGDTAAAAERLARLEAQRVEALANLQMLERQLADANAAQHLAEQRVAAEWLAAERQTAQRQAEFEAVIARETASRHVLEQALASSQEKLSESEAARCNAEQRHASEMKTAAGQLVERQREFESQLAQTTAVKDASNQRLREAEATLERIHGERAAEAIAAAAQRTQLESKLATATANGETLERRLTEVTDALHTAEELVVNERVASTKHATQRQIEFDAKMTAASNELFAQHSQFTTQLVQASAAHAALEQKLADADQRHASALKASATELTEQQSKYETRLAEVTTAREIISQQLRDTETTLTRIRQESEANAVASAERLSQRESELAAAFADRQALEGRLAKTESALNDAEARALADRTAALQQSAQRQAEFDAQLTREIQARTVVERDLAENRLAAEQTRQSLLEQSAALTTEMRELEVRLTHELARERADYEDKLANLQTQLRALDVEREGIVESLATSQAQLEGLSRVHKDANENFERIRQAKEVEVAEREEQIKDLAARHALSQEAAQQALAKLENELRAAVTAHRQQVERLHNSLNAIMEDFDEMRRHRDKLQVEADRLPQLTNHLESSRTQSRRQFEGSPIGILRCSETGVLKEANQALIAVLGYRTGDELTALGSADFIFDSPDDFRWLIERCERTPTESVDCIWKKKNGSRRIMRLRAIRLSADLFDIVAEDVTTLRAVEESRRQGQRMEAMGRLASEAAVTCENLLRNVSQEGQQWLATVSANTTQRHQGELIFRDVTRAASILGQLSAFGDKQTSALAGVDVSTVLRDLAPALKRVAGDDIELILPKKAFALDVDVDAERVERVLINIAAYGRARMPLGGRLIVDVARVLVDRDFVRKHPNVRPGAHALISVSKVRTALAEWPIDMREPGEATPGANSERPSIDLEALQGLIADCGGHLWMNAEPGGDMEVKIHLPLRSADKSGIAGAVRSALGHSVSSWFQS